MNFETSNPRSGAGKLSACQSRLLQRVVLLIDCSYEETRSDVPDDINLISQRAARILLLSVNEITVFLILLPFG